MIKILKHQRKLYKDNIEDMRKKNAAYYEWMRYPDVQIRPNPYNTSFGRNSRVKRRRVKIATLREIAHEIELYRQEGSPE